MKDVLGGISIPSVPPAAIDAALDRTKVPTSVYHNLIEAVHQNMDKLHRYMGLRKKAMGLDELHMYDIYASMLPEADAEITERLKMAFPRIPMLIVNDVVVGWAGSLECSEGVHLVAGTGAISYGRTNDGREARANGWSEFFGDEGSCYWIGKQAMSLFSQQADGRKPKGALYEIVRNELNLKSDLEFIDVVENNYAPYRDKVASFQLFAQKAALLGDNEAKKLYFRAAQYLADSAFAIIKKLGWENKNVPVSYYGGLFKTGDLILDPLKDCLKVINCTLIAPKYTAAEGALLLCIKNFK